MIQKYLGENPITPAEMTTDPRQLPCPYYYEVHLAFCLLHDATPKKAISRAISHVLWKAVIVVSDS